MSGVALAIAILALLVSLVNLLDHWVLSKNREEMTRFFQGVPKRITPEVVDRFVEEFRADSVLRARQAMAVCAALKEIQRARERGEIDS